MPSLALVEGPLLEGAAELTAGIITGLQDAGIAAKCAPLSALARIFGKPKSDPDTDKKQKKEDGKKVIKVSDAIKIVQDSLDGLGGTTSELLDVIRGVMPINGASLNKTAPNISVSIAEKLRKGALQQLNPERSVDGKHRTRK